MVPRSDLRGKVLLQALSGVKLEMVGTIHPCDSNRVVRRPSKPLNAVVTPLARLAKRSSAVFR